MARVAPILCALAIMPIYMEARADEVPDWSVTLPPGETRLSDIGLYRVSWQSYGREAVVMPPSWRGHADAVSGIMYQDKGRILDRSAFVMHPPWRVPPGRTWVEYSLALPAPTPICLSFGIAMGPDTTTAKKSDGVTFSCSLVEGGRETELMRQHHVKAEWRDYDFDLSEYAGKTIVVRLQVEPGPRNDSAFDHAFFGDAKITSGDAQAYREQLLHDIVSSKAYEATAKCGLAPLCNTAQHGVAPANLLPCTNALEQSGNEWHFSYEGDDCRLVYRYTPTSGTLDDFVVQMDGGPPFQPAVGGGASVHVDKNEATLEARGGKAVRVMRDNDVLNVLWEYDIAGKPLRIDWTYKILGKSMLVSARCDEPLVSSFSLGDIGPTPMCKTIGVPGLLGCMNYLRTPGVFICRYLDWSVSHASRTEQGEATYNQKTDGVRNPLVENGYIAVSPNMGEALPNIPNPPSPYLAELGPRIVLDIWRHHEGTYNGDAENLRELKDNGVDHLAIISHVWQCYGYDTKLPDHLPANPALGGDIGMAAFGRVANDCGYPWALHENYVDLYPDAPSYDPSARVLLADGSPAKAWFNPSTKVQGFGLKCNRSLGFARQTSPEIHRRFGTTAAYLDVHTCAPPSNQLDHQADQPMAAQARARVTYDTELFQFMRDTHGGPLFGEGRWHFYWAGLCDGVEAEVVGGEDHMPLLDFDLLKMHPQMVNHGMGYYEHWYRPGYNLRWGIDAGSMTQIDKYRAQELAYGHAGFVGDAQTDNIVWVAREHHLMYPVQRLYGTAKPVEIRYEVDGQMVTASAALAGGNTLRQRIRYDNGLTIWVNWRAEPWPIEGHLLPQWGFLAIAPDTEVSTALRDGKVADYAKCPEYVFADARTYAQAAFLGETKDIEPRLLSFKYLGENRIQVTYEWIVGESLNQDYRCFVHGIQSDGDGSQGIEFQQDHSLPKPTTEWRKGDRIVDGPHEFQVSDRLDACDLVVGLQNDHRILLRGHGGFEPRVAIARLKLQRQNGKITNITADSVDGPPNENARNQIDFASHLNPPGTWIEFGDVSTDGAVKIERENNQLVLIPLSRDRSFHVSMNLEALAPSADVSRVQVRALAAGTHRDLGPAGFKWDDGRLIVAWERSDAGHYVIVWK